MIQEACPSSMEATPTSPPPLPVRVGYLVSTRAYGGPERQIVGVARALDRSRFTPIIITFVCHPNEERPLLTEARKAGIPTATVHMPTTFDPRGAIRLIRLLRSTCVRLLCTRGYKGDILGLLAGRALSLPVVVTCGGWTGHTLLVRLYEWLDRFACRIADRVIAVSEAMRQQVIQMGGAPASVVVVPNAVDSEQFAPGDGSLARAEMGIPQDATVIASVGRLSPEKGHRYLVEAVSLLQSERPYHLLLVGDGPERARLEAMVKSLGLSPVTTFLGWRLDVVDLYRASDIVALPSLTEGMPNAALEAMACGKPVVASDVGGVAEALCCGEAGLLVPTAQPAALAGALSYLMERPELAQSLGQRGREKARRMTLALNAAALEALYRDVTTAA